MTHRKDAICAAKYECSICKSKTWARAQAERARLSRIVGEVLDYAGGDMGIQGKGHVLSVDKTSLNSVLVTIYDDEDNEVGTARLDITITSAGSA